MNKIIKNVLQLAFFLGLGLFLIWWAIKGFTPQQKAEMMDAFKNANYFWLLPSIFLALLSHLSRAMRWQQLISPIVGFKPRLSNAFLSIMVGYFANLAFPRLGEVTRCGIVARYDKIPFEKAFGTVITERIIDLLILLSLFVIVIFLQFEVLGNYAMESIVWPLQAKFASGSLLFYGTLVLVITAFVALFYWLRKNIGTNPIFKKINHFLKGLVEGISAIKKIDNIPLFVFHTVFIWLMYFSMTYICIFTLSETENLGVGAGLAILVMGGFSMVATQGGLGAYPLVVSKLLVLYGILESTGYAFGWIAWTSQTIFVLVMGVISLVALPLVNKVVD